MPSLLPDPPHLQLSAHAHDRRGNDRRDEQWLEQAWRSADGVLVMSGNRLRVDDRGAVWSTPGEADDLAAGIQAVDGTPVRVLLGERGGDIRWALLLPSSLARTAPEDWKHPREALLGVALSEGGADQTAWLLHAVGMAEWHAVTRFCPKCGHRLAASPDGHQATCGSCGRVQFPRTDPAVIMLITEGAPGTPDERCLLGRQVFWPERRFSTLAGFCEPGESCEDAVRREAAEETGVVVDEVTYAGNQPWPFPASLMLGFYGRVATVGGASDITVDETEIAEARWLTRDELRAGAESGEVRLPGGVSISRSLIEGWYGQPLPGNW